MKKTLIFLIFALLVLSMCACTSSANTNAGGGYTVTKNGTDYIVDTENSTISDGTNTYQYTISGKSNGYSVNITYPDGSTYWWETQDNSGFGGYSDNYDASRYADGAILLDVIESNAPKQTGSGNILLIFVLLAIGIFNTVSPRTAWYLGYGWRFKNAEPSDLALGLNRVGGVVAILIAVILIFV